MSQVWFPWAIFPSVFLLYVQDRSKWIVGSSLEVYSESEQKWYKGTIKRIFEDKAGEWLQVRHKETSDFYRV